MSQENTTMGAAVCGGDGFLLRQEAGGVRLACPAYPGCGCWTNGKGGSTVNDSTKAEEFAGLMTSDYWEGWRITNLIPPQRRGDWWRVMAMWGPMLPSAKDQPDFLYTGGGPTRDEAIADIRSRCEADPKWNKIAEKFV